MKLKIINAMGTHVADADVKWTEGADAEALDRQLKDDFMPYTTAVLPSRHPGLAWQIEMWT